MKFTAALEKICESATPPSSSPLKLCSDLGRIAAGIWSSLRLDLPRATRFCASSNEIGL
jgi:hypothetical protein